MHYGKTLAVSVLVMGALAAPAKKKNVVLPADVLQAKTALVVIDPGAGVSMDAPNANRIARENVEQALRKWGRFDLASDPSTADLVFVVRKGNGGGSSMGDASESSGNSGPQVGAPPTGGTPSDSSAADSHSQAQFGSPDDMLAVYRGKTEKPLRGSPVWRYMGRNVLAAPSVPAVDVFRKLVEDSEKQLEQQGQQPKP